ncbi:MAG: amidase, partial [Candidatus Mucispirillum faecigallinarum]|nr:amidase [Candidatus Mucispirillum faecigallinarum]
MAELTSLSIAELSKGFNNKEFSSTEVTKAYIEKMEQGRKYNAFITETPEYALKQAAESDKRISKGERLSDLDGVPLAVKDLFCTENIRTTAASKILENFIPPYESTVTANLLKAGSVFTGKTNLD